MNVFEGRTPYIRPFFAKITLFALAILVLNSPISAAQPTEISITDSVSTKQDSVLSKAQDPVGFSFGEATQIDMFGVVSKTIGYLLVIVVLIFGLVYFLKNFIYGKKGQKTTNSSVKVLNSTFISPKKSIMLVEAVGRILLVSVTDSNMSLLTEMNRDEYNEYIENQGTQETGRKTAVPFTDMLKKVMKQGKA